jgi:hypothetical protein
MNRRRRSIMRRAVVLVGGAALAMGLLTGPANAASSPGSCPTPYNGPVTFEELLKTPEVENALRDEVYGEDHVRLVFDELDNNADQRVCWKSVGNGNQFRSIYAGNYVDNSAAPK